MDNRGKEGGTLYRALAQAITNEEQDHRVIRQIIANSLMSSWSMYGKILIPAYQGKIKGFTPQKIPEKVETVQRAYLQASLEMGIEGTVVELMAAAHKFQFTYTLVLFENDRLRVMNCQDEVTKSGAHAKYFFLRSGDRFEEWDWEYLVPYGKDAKGIKIPSGVYPLNIFNSYPFNQGKAYFNQREAVPKRFLEFPSVFALEDGLFYGCTESGGADVFSSLSLLLYGSANLTLETFEFLRGLRNSPVSIHLISKRSQRFPMTFEPGTLEDVKTASIKFNFTYTIYGLDENVNFLRLAQTGRSGGVKHFTFLTRTRKQFPMEWCVLTPVMDSKLTPRAPTENPQVHTTKSPLTPITAPYTMKKEGLMGIKYRVLAKNASERIKVLMGFQVPSGNPHGQKERKEIEEGGRYGSEVDYFADISDTSSHHGTGKRSHRPKKDKLPFISIFGRGYRVPFKLRNSRVSPTEENLVDRDIIITYEEY